MKKFVLLWVMIIILFSSNTAFASSTVKIWHDPSLNISSLKKIFVLPLVLNLRAGTDMMSDRQFTRNFYDWIIKGIRATPQGKKLIIKTLEDVARELEFLYGGPPPSIDVFLERAYVNGYEALIYVSMGQEFTTEYIPERSFNYTTYNNVYVNGPNGYMGTISVPHNNTITIPDQEITYLDTECVPELYLLNEYIPDVKVGNFKGNHNAIVNYRIYRRYQGGAVTKVLENIIKASMKSLFTGKKK